MDKFYYRFLDEDPTKTSRDSIRTALAFHLPMNADVTIDNYDLYINSAAGKVIKSKPKNQLQRAEEIFTWNRLEQHSILR